jgi:hypothetical protein
VISDEEDLLHKLLQQSLGEEKGKKTVCKRRRKKSVKKGGLVKKKSRKRRKETEEEVEQKLESQNKSGESKREKSKGEESKEEESKGEESKGDGKRVDGGKNGKKEDDEDMNKEVDDGNKEKRIEGEINAQEDLIQDNISSLITEALDNPSSLSDMTIQNPLSASDTTQMNVMDPPSQDLNDLSMGPSVEPPIKPSIVLSINDDADNSGVIEIEKASFDKNLSSFKANNIFTGRKRSRKTPPKTGAMVIGNPLFMKDEHMKKRKFKEFNKNKEELSEESQSDPTQSILVSQQAVEENPIIDHSTTQNLNTPSQFPPLVLQFPPSSQPLPQSTLSQLPLPNSDVYLCPNHFSPIVAATSSPLSFLCNL